SLLCQYLMYTYRDPLNLHSFPTRRSSDLGGAAHLVGSGPRLRLPARKNRSRRQMAGTLHRVADGQRVSEMRKGTAYPASPNFTRDRKSTRLNSSHVKTSYAVFCLKKKNKQ